MKKILIAFISLLNSSCFTVQDTTCEDFSKSISKVQFNIIIGINGKGGHGLRSSFNGTNPLTGQKATFKSQTAWYSDFYSHISPGDTVISYYGEPGFEVHKKDRVLYIYNYCKNNGQDYSFNIKLNPSLKKPSKHELMNASK